MEQPKPVGSSAPGVGRADRPLGRGLEDVARVFLSTEGEERATDPGGVRRPVRPLARDQSAPDTLLLRPAAEVPREQVAAALQEYSGALEEGLRAIDAEIPCGSCGEIDLLALDRTHQLTIIDFDPAASDDLLLRGFAHVDWVVGNLPNLRRMFRGQAINFSLQPRLFLLAPRFSSRLRCVARQVTSLRIDWVRYHCVETPGRVGILFEPLPAE